MNIYIYTDKDYSIWDTSSSTFCYYPFSDNNTDSTGNTTLSAGGTKQTLGYNFSGTSTISFSKSSSTTVFCSYWIKVTSGISEDSANIQFGPTGKGRMCLNIAHNSDFNNNIQCNDGNGWYGAGKPILTLGQWVHVAYGFNGSEFYLYKNGVKTVIRTATTYGSATESNFIVNQFNNASYNLTVSDFILDTVDRESEIIPHFNATKSLYGIS